MQRATWTALFAVAIASALATGIVVTHFADAADGSTPSTFVPIVPCRLADTRPALDNVGFRSTPIGPALGVMFQVTGTNGNCSIPSTATGIASNIAAVNPTASSYLTVYPADAARPLSSNLNWTAGSSPTPNQVTVGLSTGGAIVAYNLAGFVDVVIDIVGYYTATTAGTPGATGPMGSTGPTGPTGATGSAGAPFAPRMAAFQGAISNSTVLTNGTFSFLGATDTLTVTASQRLVASASASIGLASGTAELAVSVCTQPVLGGVIATLNAPVYVYVTGTRRETSVAVVGQVGAGEFRVGFCASRSSSGSIAIDQNDYASGWVMVVDSTP